MMRRLRNNLLKRLLGLTLLCILVLKFCAFSISSFSSCNNLCAVEKTAEENKEKEEESSDKAKKKLWLYESSLINNEDRLWISYSQPLIYCDALQSGSFPVKTVPTPPPNFLS